jgi:hypothetical protein
LSGELWIVARGDVRMTAVSNRRVRRAGRRLLAACSLLLLLALLVRPLLPALDLFSTASFEAAAADAADYTIDPLAPDQPVAVEAQSGALVKRAEAGDGFGALEPAPQAIPKSAIHFMPAGRSPDDRPPPPRLVSCSLTRGPPRFHA